MTDNINQIEAAIIKIWPRLPERFHAWQVTGHVYQETQLQVYSDTIMHTLRYMRKDGKIDYICVNRQKSEYEKAR